MGTTTATTTTTVLTMVLNTLWIPVRGQQFWDVNQFHLFTLTWMGIALPLMWFTPFFTLAWQVLLVRFAVEFVVLYLWCFLVVHPEADPLFFVCAIAACLQMALLWLIVSFY